MKRVLLTLVTALLFFQLSAQDNLFVKGDKVLNLGIGLGSIGWGTGYANTMLPLSASFEVGILDNVADVGSIGIGGLIGYSGYKYEAGVWQWKYTDLIIAARGNFHYPLVDKLDTYAAVSLGYESITVKETGDGTIFPGGYSTLGSGVFFGVTAGGRYYFSENFAAMAELGYGITWLTLGVALKF